ncbi:hypothetical protein GCM10025859_61570 [Alicyclobacillus fastidiosus]|nr:hypothetical protein GCM10025859_60410 [Alicyclobacillus fastidiosus]GMA65717.1 hypothetical protein GCM10025859_61570 [Alicyclobacillus fastidiosus]
MGSDGLFESIHCGTVDFSRHRQVVMFLKGLYRSFRNATVVLGDVVVKVTEFV